MWFLLFSFSKPRSRLRNFIISKMVYCVLRVHKLLAQRLVTRPPSGDRPVDTGYEREITKNWSGCGFTGQSCQVTWWRRYVIIIIIIIITRSNQRLKVVRGACCGPGGGTPLYGLYRYVRPQRVWFSAVLVINWVSILAILVINRVSIFAL